MLQNAYDTCKCTPWNFPYIETGEMEICDMFGSACFNDMMSQVVIGEQCDCPEDCDSVTYTKFETSKDLNVEELCSDTTSWVYKHMKNTKRNVEGHAYRLLISFIIIYTANVSPIKVTGKPRVTGGTP